MPGFRVSGMIGACFTSFLVAGSERELDEFKPEFLCRVELWWGQCEALKMRSGRGTLRQALACSSPVP